MNAKLPPGYPPRYFEQRAGFGKIFVCVVLFFGMFAAGFGWALRQDHHSVPTWVGLGLALVVLFGVVSGQLADRYAVRIIPYYDKKLPGAQTYLGGQALARNCLHLDRLAAERGLQSISEFGFNDPLMGETVIWHDPADGFVTISGLRAAVTAQPKAVDDAAAVMVELEKIQAAFEKACVEKVRFAFLLELGHSTSGRVWELRQGDIGG